MKHVQIVVVATLVALVMAGAAMAQRGAGDASGVSRQGLNLPIVSLTGTVSEVKIGPCENTTGRSAAGAHLIVKAADNRVINLHLGPATSVDDVLKAVKAGTAITADTFRTDQMPQDAYVVRTITVGNQAIQLRDSTLRPRWAGSGIGGGQGQGMG
ncbi:MAG: hypothetical protein WCJ64_12705, partial [Rhodospirillaceae bacterium]